MNHIPKIIIKTIDPDNQRFGECDGVKGSVLSIDTIFRAMVQ